MDPLIAAIETSARAVEVNGGMGLLSSNIITAILGGIAAIIGALGTLLGIVLWGRRKDRNRPVDSDDRFVTQLECKNHRCAIEKQITAIGPALNRLFMKMNELDRRSEDRVVRIHDRIGPIAEKVAADHAKIETIGSVVEAALANSTIGGKK